MSVMSEMRMIGWKCLGKSKTSRLDDEASHSSSRELMITCRSSGLLHLHTNRPLELASFWQSLVFSALSSPRSTKESLEGFYLCQRMQFLVFHMEEFNQLSRWFYAYEPCIRGRAQNVLQNLSLYNWQVSLHSWWKILT